MTNLSSCQLSSNAQLVTLNQTLSQPFNAVEDAPASLTLAPIYYRDNKRIRADATLGFDSIWLVI